MGRRLFVGRLPLDSTERELIELFSSVGGVTAVSIKFDRETGKQRGFAFVTMADADGAAEAIRALNGAPLRGKNIRVVEAESKRGKKTARSGSVEGELDEEAVIRALKSGQIEIPKELWGELAEPEPGPKPGLDRDEVIDAIKSGQIEIPKELWGDVSELSEPKPGLDRDEVIDAIKSGQIEIPKELWGDAPNSAAPAFVAPPRRRWPWGLALLLLAAAAGAYWLTRGAPPAPDAKTILITPLQAFGKGGDAYVGYAFAQALAVNLAPISALKVLPVPEQARGAEESAAAARRLGAGRLVLGSVRRADDTIKVSLTLVDPADSRVLWGVQDQSGDVRHMAALLAENLARELGVVRPRQYAYVTNLTGGRKMSAAKETGLALGALRRGQFRQALAPTAALVARFPRSPAAAVLRSHALMLAWDADPAAGNLAALKMSLGRIEKCDPNSPYAKVYRAYLSYRDGKPQQAIDRYARILERTDLAPATRAWVLRYRAVAASNAGDLDAALADLRESLRLDPTNGWTSSILSEALEQAGELEEALARAEQGVALMPSFWRSHMTVGAALAALDRFADAAAAYGRACELSPAQWPCALYALNQLKSGRRKQAAAAARLAAEQTDSAWGRFHLACYAAVSGDTAGAVRHLRAAVDLGFADARIGSDADLAALRDSPDYQRLVKEVERHAARPKK